jgi:hypothetical protein
MRLSTYLLGTALGFAYVGLSDQALAAEAMTYDWSDTYIGVQAGKG